MPTEFNNHTLAAFYAAAPKPDSVPLHKRGDNWKADLGPSLRDFVESWRWEPPKMIDMGIFINFGLDVALNDMNPVTGELNYTYDEINRVNSIVGTEYGIRYQTRSGRRYETCRPRQDFIYSWVIYECPIPEGFNVEVLIMTDGKTAWTCKTSAELRKSGMPKGTCGFKITGLSEGYRYTWE